MQVFRTSLEISKSAKFINKIILINKIRLIGGESMSEIIEMGTVSSRGQICIPNDIREEMNLKEGNKILFVLQDGSLLVKKVTMQTFAEITKPLKEAAAKLNFKESDAEGIVDRFRKSKKMKAVFDTNVLISATFWNGDSNKAVERAESKEIELVLSKEIIEEFSRVLGYKEIQDKIISKNLEMNRTVEKVTSISTIVEPKEKFNIIKDDHDDDKFLDCAYEAKADFIVSQNKHLLNIKEFKGIQIITPS